MPGRACSFSLPSAGHMRHLPPHSMCPAEGIEKEQIRDRKKISTEIPDCRNTVAEIWNKKFNATCLIDPNTIQFYTNLHFCPQVPPHDRSTHTRLVEFISLTILGAEASCVTSGHLQISESISDSHSMKMNTAKKFVICKLSRLYTVMLNIFNRMCHTF